MNKEISIEENNRLIAEFMGAVVNKNWTDKLTYCYTKENVPTKHSSYNWAVDEMQYHTSWDWLMPVVERIELITPVHIWSDECKIKPHYDTVFYNNTGESGNLKKIDVVWNTITQFIQWYNSTIKTDSNE